MLCIFTPPNIKVYIYILIYNEQIIGEGFLIFWLNPTNNHKLVMISFLFFVFLKYEKDAIFFNEKMLGKTLGFDRMHGNKTFFIFLKEEINLKIETFFKFLIF